MLLRLLSSSWLLRFFVSSKKNDQKHEIWKSDVQLNNLLDQRKLTMKNTEAYKETTKKIKRRVRNLRNEKLCKEANSINELSSRRQVEELFKNFKADNLPFKTPVKTNKCDPKLLKDHFQKHFTSEKIGQDPIELTNIPSFLLQFQSIRADNVNTEPPDEFELRKIITNLKNGKSSNDVPIIYIKSSMSSQEFVNEICGFLQQFGDPSAYLKSGVTPNWYAYGRDHQREVLRILALIEDFKLVPHSVRYW